MRLALTSVVTLTLRHPISRAPGSRFATYPLIGLSPVQGAFRNTAQEALSQPIYQQEPRLTNPEVPEDRFDPGQRCHWPGYPGLVPTPPYPGCQEYLTGQLVQYG